MNYLIFLIVAIIEMGFGEISYLNKKIVSLRQHISILFRSYL